MKPLIQIDDEVREMTDAEYERYLAELSETPAEEPAPEE
jgi:hypothetical protein